MTRLLAALLMVAAGAGSRPAAAQEAVRAPVVTAPAPPAWHAALSLANVYEGNVNHDVTPVQSYGLVPALDVAFAAPRSGFTFDYEIADNRYTATNEWDRVSHAMEAAVRKTLASRLRFEAAAEASWKGTSEDRELANVVAVSPRVVFLASKRTRLSFTGTYRYKEYVDEPGSTGPNPSAGVKFDRRFGANRRLTLGYKYQKRISEVVRNRYRRSAYTAELTTPLGGRAATLAVELEYRSQQYERLIKVGSGRALRRDDRVAAEIHYDRAVTGRSYIRWTYAFESRQSNDVSKEFFAPVVAMTVHYQLR